MFFERSERPLAWSTLPLQQRRETEIGVKQILRKSKVHPRMIEIMTSLAKFAQVMYHGKRSSLDHQAVGEDLYNIEHDLLAFSEVSEDDRGGEIITSACRTGALLYMKAILEEFPYSAMGSSILLRQLQESLSWPEIRQDLADVQLWLLMIGGILSKGDMREWFIGRLNKHIVAHGSASADDEETALGRFMSLRDVFGQIAEDLWRQASLQNC